MQRLSRAAAFWSILLLFGFGFQAQPLLAEQTFPEPEALRPAVDFWMRIYLEVDTDSGLLHDARHLDAVYERLDFPENTSPRARRKTVKARKRHWRAVLHRLGEGQGPRDASERAAVASLADALGRQPTARDYRRAAHRLRFQLGQRDKFREGLIRAGAYEEQIHAIFREMGLPEDLAHLPHVESSFNPRAYSKYGAAGMWQFMRSTARLYLDVNYVVDERLDPIRSTRAAARLLRDNYEKLGTWPLAITAYNHGAAGMERAKRVLGTDDIAAIIEKYRSRTFGFASRNFYPQFLAARRIAHDHHAYFGQFKRRAPKPVDTVRLPFYADIADLERHLGVSRDVIARYNPGLRPPVFRSDKRIPKGFVLRLPAGTVRPAPAQWLAAVPREHRHAEQIASRFHRVRRGETLSEIARIHGTSVSSIVALNGLRSRHRIYAGQMLEVLDTGGGERPGADAVRTASAEKSETAPDATSIAPHRVGRGETLSTIARRYRTSVSRLVALNDLDSRHRIYAGQSLRVPVRLAAGQGEGLPARHRVRQGDTLTTIAERYGTTVRELVVLNELQNQRWIYPGQELRLRREQAAEPSGEKMLAEAPGSQAPDAPLGSPSGAQQAVAAASAEAAGELETMDVATSRAEREDALQLPSRPRDSRWRRIDGDRIVVDAEETLGHYADWLEIPTQRLRNLNGLRFGRPVRIGQRLRLDFSRVSREEFFERRVAYHKAIEEDFLGSYRVTGTVNHTLRRGENLWRLSHQVYDVPSWLLHRFNAERDLTRLQPGTELTIPVVEAHTSS